MAQQRHEVRVGVWRVVVVVGAAGNDGSRHGYVVARATCVGGMVARSRGPIRVGPTVALGADRLEARDNQ